MAVYNPLDPNVIIGEIKGLESIVKDFCNASDLPFVRVQANPKAMEEIVVRVDKRKQYVKYFHNDMTLNEYKVMALKVYWILKLRPFWVTATEKDNEDLLDIGTRINEKIALHIFLSMIKKFNSQFFEDGQDLVKDYSAELLYSFRYRDISKEAMYLMLDPFYYMYYFKSSVDPEGEKII